MARTLIRVVAALIAWTGWATVATAALIVAMGIVLVALGRRLEGAVAESLAASEAGIATSTGRLPARPT